MDVPFLRVRQNALDALRDGEMGLLHYLEDKAMDEYEHQALLLNAEFTDRDVVDSVNRENHLFELLFEYGEVASPCKERVETRTKAILRKADELKRMRRSRKRNIQGHGSLTSILLRRMTHGVRRVEEEMPSLDCIGEMAVSLNYVDKWGKVHRETERVLRSTPAFSHLRDELSEHRIKSSALQRKHHNLQREREEVW